MASACTLKDKLRNDNQVFPNFKLSIFEICLHLSNSNFTPYFLTSSPLSSYAGISKQTPSVESDLSLPALPIASRFQFFPFSRFHKELIPFHDLKFSKMPSSLSTNSIDSVVFYVEQSSNDQSLPGPNRPTVLNSRYVRQ